MDEPKAQRLNKVAAEFGRSTDVIVDFLGKKGFVIDTKNGPNAKVPPEAYDILFSEFSTDKALKDLAHKRIEDKFVKSEIITIQEKKTPASPEKEDDNIDEILNQIKTKSREDENKV